VKKSEKIKTKPHTRREDRKKGTEGGNGRLSRQLGNSLKAGVKTSKREGQNGVGEKVLLSSLKKSRLKGDLS